MSEMITPYVGITGFMTAQEVSEVLQTETFADTSRLLMCGVLVSWNTLEGGLARRPRRYPPVETLAGIFQHHPRVLNLIHYNSAQAGLFDQLVRLTDLAGPYVQGFQLNIVWPDVNELTQWREAYPHHRLVIQVSGSAYRQVGRSPHALCDKLRGYRQLATDILFDPSGGKGRRFNTEVARRVLTELQQAFGGEMGIGVAGGLDPNTLDLVEPLLTAFPHLSIDAEGRLRDKDDNLDLGKAKSYLVRALQMADPVPAR